MTKCTVCWTVHFNNNCFFDTNCNELCSMCNTVHLDVLGELYTEIDINRVINVFKNENRCYKCGMTGHYIKNCKGNKYADDLGEFDITLLKKVNGCSANLHYIRIVVENRCEKCGSQGHDKKKCKSKTYADDLSPGDIFMLQTILLSKINNKGQCYKCGTKGHFYKKCKRQGLSNVKLDIFEIKLLEIINEFLVSNLLDMQSIEILLANHHNIN